MSLKKLLGHRPAKIDYSAEDREAEKLAGTFVEVRRVKGPSIFRAHSAADSGIVTRYTNRLSYDDLVNAESELGRTLFGPIPAGHQREFFEQRKNVWVWYERWIGENGTPAEMTIRYEVRPNGVYKKSTGTGYQKIIGDELDNFCSAVRSYFDLVKQKLYC